jgi:SAM-dependent methyltransferase
LRNTADLASGAPQHKRNCRRITSVIEHGSVTPLQAATDFWDGANGIREERTNACWLAKPTVRQYVNERIGVDRPLWPLNWFKSLYPNKFARGLSIGCGAGALERALIDLDVCETIDAFDGAVGALHDAQSNKSTPRIRYYAADFNHAQFRPNTYDIVFFNQSLHHVARLEYLLSQVARTLKPNGLLYIDEYVGPSRHEWTTSQLAAHQAIYSLLPRHWRLYDRVPPPIEYNDPSEAIRSSEILTQIELGFDVLERRDYGGTLLSILVPVMNWNAAPEEFLNACGRGTRMAPRRRKDLLGRSRGAAETRRARERGEIALVAGTEVARPARPHRARRGKNGAVLETPAQITPARNKRYFFDFRSRQTLWSCCVRQGTGWLIRCLPFPASRSRRRRASDCRPDPWR